MTITICVGDYTVREFLQAAKHSIGKHTLLIDLNEEHGAGGPDEDDEDPDVTAVESSDDEVEVPNDADEVVAAEDNDVAEAGGNGQNDREGERHNCAVCLTEESANVALVPCGHTSFCLQCAERIVNETETRTCPICRGDVTMLMHLYHS